MDKAKKTSDTTRTNASHTSRQAKGIAVRASTSAPIQGELKAEHAVVLQALEIANLALQRVVSLEEIIKALSAAEVEALESAYDNSLIQSLPLILRKLTARDIVFSPGRIGKQRYYGSTNVLNPEYSKLPEIKSRRQRVLSLVRDTVQKLERAVRIGDVIDHAQGISAYADIIPVFITRSLLSLVETGEIKCVGTIRGDAKGTRLYLPSELDPSLYWPKEPLSWIGLVEKVFNQIWEERKAEAEAVGRKPRPISTGEVRARMAAMPDPHPRLNNPQYMINAMLQLAKTDDAVIRKIEREGERILLWVPVGVSDDEIEIRDGYAKNSERVAEALRRTVERLGRPVNTREVQEEINNDPFLRPSGTSRIASILADAAKETVDWNHKERRPRVTRHVLRAGRVDGVAYYYHDTKTLPKAQNYVRLRQIESSWESASVEENLLTLPSCSLASVAVGRAMLVAAQTKAFLDELGRLFEDGKLDVFTRSEAETLQNTIRRINDDAEKALSSYTNDYGLPAEVDLAIPGWTAEELLPVIKPFYTRAQKIETPNVLVRLLHGDIRRFPNPNFESRFSKIPASAVEYLYDRTDALLFIARQWGGYECRLQANFARNELRQLRDPRFVFPALDSEDFNRRLAAVSCLAFLWSDEGNTLLKRIAITDRDYGIRMSALWAYAFANGEAGHEFVMSRSRDDPEARVRDFAKQIVQPDELSVWSM